MAANGITFRLPTWDDVSRNARLALERGALQAVSIITRRTAKGISSNGSAFKPYTPWYARRKGATGRNSAPPDLTLTGTMLRALRVLRVDPRGQRIWIGWEGQHTTRNVLGGYSAGRFLQIDQGRVSALDARPLRKKEAAFVKRASAQSRAQILSTPYAVLVPRLDRLRPFFHLDLKAERNQVREVINATMVKKLSADLNRPR